MNSPQYVTDLDVTSCLDFVVVTQTQCAGPPTHMVVRFAEPTEWNPGLYSPSHLVQI